MKIRLFDLLRGSGWSSGQLRDAHNFVQGTFTPLTVDDRSRDRLGFVRIEQVEMEDGERVDALLTHPAWRDNATIKGTFPMQRMPQRARFKAKVGFVRGATGSDGVRFQVWEKHLHAGRMVWSRVVDLPKRPDGTLDTIEADLSHLAGLDVALELRVDTGDGIGFRVDPVHSGQDWAAWIDPVIEEDDPNRPDGQVVRVSLKNLRVDRATDFFGDDPYIGAIYFRSILSQKGGTKVVVLDSLDLLAQDVGTGADVAIPQSANLGVVDTISPIALKELVRETDKRLCFFGIAFVAMERNVGFMDLVRVELMELAARLRQEFLAMERLTADEAQKRAEGLEQKLREDTLPRSGFELPKGPSAVELFFRTLIPFSGGPDAPVGQEGAIFTNLSRQGLRELDVNTRDLREKRAEAERNGAKPKLNRIEEQLLDAWDSLSVLGITANGQIRQSQAMEVDAAGNEDLGRSKWTITCQLDFLGRSFPVTTGL